MSMALEYTMIKKINFILNGFKDFDSIIKAAEFAEQADELSLEKMFIVEAVFDYGRKELMEFVEGIAKL